MAYGRPGVYISERLLPAPIAVLGTANAAGAAIGAFAQGPTTVTRVTSWYDFVQTFGGYSAAFPATFGVGQFFQNGGSELWVRRVLASDAAAATASLPRSGTGAAIGSVTAKNLGADGNNLRVQLTAANISGYYNFYVYKESAASSSDSSPDNDVLIEQYTNVVLNDTTSSDYLPTVISLNSTNVTVAITDNVTAPSTARIPLTGGSNGTAPVASDYVSALAGFTAVDQPLVMFAPEIITVLGSSNGKTVHDAIVSWCGANNGFAVLDTDDSLTVDAAINYATSLAATSYAAVYYPYIFIADPLGRSSTSLRKIGPAGSIAGLFISTDKQYGPFKAPAGIRASVRGALALEKTFTAAELDSLNTGIKSDSSVGKPVNALRNLPGAGVVSMGSRTLLQDGTANRYVNMRRSLIYIRKNLNDLTQFALFENNDERLWSRIRTVLGVFLNDYRNQGGLRGTTQDEAFYVKCDAENNPTESIADGEVHIEVGVALQYPAEFVVITLSQKTAN
jgi:phage tail sheath protein FI